MTISCSIATMTTKKIVILKLLTEIERKQKRREKKKKKYILVECIFFIPLQSIIASKLHFQINITR